MNQNVVLDSSQPRLCHVKLGEQIAGEALEQCPPIFACNRLRALISAALEI